MTGGWSVKALGDLFDISRGGSPRPIQDFLTEDVNGVNWIMISDASASGKYIERTAKRIRPEGVARSRRVSPGDFLLTNSMSFGRPYIMKTEGCIHDGWLHLKKRDKSIDEDYFYYLLGSEATYAKFERLAAGATVKNLNIDLASSVEVPVPPLLEQRRIATILDKSDSLRRKRQEAAGLADDFLRATFVDLFGDPVTNSKGWTTQPLASLGTLDRGVSKHRPRNDPRLLGGDYPLIQTGEIANCDGYIRAFTSTYSEMGLRQSKLWPAGTLCITIAANIAKTGILLFPACFPDSVVGCSAVDRSTVEYVRFWLSFLQQTLEANAPASAQKNINLAILRDLQIPVPPRDRVERFTAAVDKVETIRTAQRQAVDEGQKLHQALEHALLTP